MVFHWFQLRKPALIVSWLKNARKTINQRIPNTCQYVFKHAVSVLDRPHGYWLNAEFFSAYTNRSCQTMSGAYYGRRSVCAVGNVYNPIGNRLVLYLYDIYLYTWTCNELCTYAYIPFLFFKNYTRVYHAMVLFYYYCHDFDTFSKIKYKKQMSFMRRRPIIVE